MKDKIHVEGDRQLQWSSYRFQIIVISINEVLDDESFCGFFLMLFDSSCGQSFCC